MKFADGATYEGDWVLGCAHGHGKFTFMAGEVYAGEFADNMRHGQGLTIH